MSKVSSQSRLCKADYALSNAGYNRRLVTCKLLITGSRNLCGRYLPQGGPIVNSISFLAAQQHRNLEHIHISTICVL